MFSPDFTRYIIDPENVTENCDGNRKVFVEKEIFRFSIFDQQKIKYDYMFFVALSITLLKVLSSVGEYEAVLVKEYGIANQT